MSSPFTAFAAGEVRDGPRQAQHAVVAAAAQPQAGLAAPRASGPPPHRARHRGEPPRRSPRRCSAQRRGARPGARARRGRARAPRAEASPGPAASSLGGGRADLDGDVDAVGQRPADPRAVAADGPRRALALLLAAPRWPHGHGLAAATSIVRHGSETVCRARATTMRPVLERLAQRLEGVARELGQLVQKQEAAVRAAELARAGRGAAADQPGARDRVVRSAKGPGPRPRQRRAPGRTRSQPTSASMASAGSSGGRIEGRRRAAIDLPTPGGPSISRLCPPAAATSSARRRPSWPRRSARSSAPRGLAARAREPRPGSLGVPSSLSWAEARRAR